METEKLFLGHFTRSVPADLCRRARTKLLVLHAATDLNDLQSHFDLEQATRNSLEKIKSKVKPLHAA